MRALGFLLGLLTTMAAAQAGTTGQATRTGCPASVPPATSNSVATAYDFVQLERSGCDAGECAAYMVRIQGDGSVTWRGDDAVAVSGSASATVDSDKARALMQRLADRGFWPLCTEYAEPPAWELAYLRKRQGINRVTPPVGPQSVLITTLSLAGASKRVKDSAANAPSWLRGLDAEIDQLADTHRWRHGEGAQETFGTDHLHEDAVRPKVGVTRLMRQSVAAHDAGLEDWLLTLPPMNEGDSSGWTALMYAAGDGTLRAMKQLYAAGGDVRQVSLAGETALFAAVASRQEPQEKVAWLAGLGADLNWRDNRGVTPLMIACRYSAGQTGLLALLLRLGADPSKRDVDGNTAMSSLDQAAAKAADPAVFDAAKALLAKSLAAR